MADGRRGPMPLLSTGPARFSLRLAAAAYKNPHTIDGLSGGKKSLPLHQAGEPSTHLYSTHSVRSLAGESTNTFQLDSLPFPSLFPKEGVCWKD